MVTTAKVITEADVMALEAKGTIREISNGQWVDEKEIDPLEEIQNDAVKKHILLKLNSLLQVPYLLIEVISPDKTVREIEEELNDHLQKGAKEIWQIYTTFPHIIVYKVDGHPMIYSLKQSVTTDLLPGFEIAVKEIFETE